MNITQTDTVRFEKAYAKLSEASVDVEKIYSDMGELLLVIQATPEHFGSKIDVSKYVSSDDNFVIRIYHYIVGVFDALFQISNMLSTVFIFCINLAVCFFNLIFQTLKFICCMFGVFIFCIA